MSVAETSPVQQTDSVTEHHTAPPWISRTEPAARPAQGAWPPPPSPIGIAANVSGNLLWRRLI